ncbi:MAG: hypothetical protein ACI4B5_04010 [Bacteroidaceae bacterium]
MAYACEMQYRIGGHLLSIQAADNIDVEFLLPSFAPFRVKDEKEQPMVRVGVDISYEMGTPQCEVGQFDCGGCVHGVFLMPDGGYQFHLRDLEGNVCCIMQSSPTFDVCHIRLCAVPLSLQAYGLNGAVMMAYAFSTAEHQTLLVHASVIRCEGRGYMMTAPSGTGKSTHTRLWYDNIPGCDLMNDDNPVLRIVDGSPIVYGSPWSGKTPCYRNVSAPVGALVRIRQRPSNSIRLMKPVEALAELLPAMSNMKWDKRVYSGVYDTLIRLISLCNIYELGCLPNAEAALLCHDTVSR